ncbi:hypothetical protein CWS43_15365 [Rahnella sp. AA]|uniref:hypothetical protein n=1 Tax=Rahnella sp. AA TaxID=2057180 RepID=UPI000C3235A4|nr:hypothetical protein [Rahnella sp. AA]PKE29435.1 hypothetical protein CWS43_15365 [Rahnella sp. AA]
MAFFTQSASPSLYLASTDSGNVGAVAFVTGAGVVSAEKGIELADALTNIDLAGNFVFSPSLLNFGDDAQVQAAFVKAVQNQVAQQPSPRGILWLPDPDPAVVAAENALIFLGLAYDGSSVTSGLANANILPNLSLFIQNGMTISLSGNTFTLSNGAVNFAGAAAPQMVSALTAVLAFDGVTRGCVGFDTRIQRLSLYNTWKWGFHFIFPHDGAFDGLISEWLPLGSADDGPTDMLGFQVSADPADPLNTLQTINNQNPNRSSLLFTGLNDDQSVTKIASFYRTVSGDVVTLIPVGLAPDEGLQTGGLVFAAGHRIAEGVVDFHVAPYGDFLVSAKAGPNGVTTELLCGLSGNEFISVVPGSTSADASRIRFVSQQGAYAADFPPPVASPTGAPRDGDSLLTGGYVTSWMTVLPPANKQNSYAAQPDGAALFGYDSYVWKNNAQMLGHVDPGYVLPDAGTTAFPMVPYAGFQPQDGKNGFDQTQSRNFEALIIGATRRQLIGSVSNRQVLSARCHTQDMRAASAANDAAAVNFTTPSGMIATLDNTLASWQKILLGQIVTPVSSEMNFTRPAPELQQAFQTNQLMMVAANSTNFCQPDGTFSNRLNIGGWSIEADVGTSLDYGDYSNIMIIKGIDGPLYDPDGDPTHNLIASPSKWTQAAQFSAPTMTRDGTPDPGQIVNLSQWLQDYFIDALSPGGEGFFDDFNALAKDPNWKGILILRAKIAEPPQDLAGITAGIRNPDRFYAHHLAIQISQIKSDPQGGGINIDRQSSVYGLIYYIDNDYDTASEGSPVQPAYGVDYDFITLTLKVLFENTAVKTFSSYTQLTLNNIFGSAVTAMGENGNNYNSIIMQGTFQNNNGQPTYGMKTLANYSFLFNNNVLSDVETLSAEMNTIRTDSVSSVVRFGLSGFMGFRLLSGTDVNGEEENIDLFSFGSPEGDFLSHTGLNYTGLGLNMAFTAADPVGSRALTFDSSQISFNMAVSTPRAGSLYQALSMELDGLTSSDSADVTPASLGYLDVVTNVQMNGVSAQWNALKFKLNLGTAGELAGKVGLNAYLLLAWSADSFDGYQALTGIKMPGSTHGAPLISLQSVLSMSYGTIQLLYTDKPGTVLHPTSLQPVSWRSDYALEDDEAPAASTGKQFMLVLNEIAIKFLGMLKIPPSGSTAFYLFGDADGTAGNSDTGLAWYAAYNNTPPEGKNALQGNRRLTSSVKGSTAND